jgi:hypothetical protein
MSSYVALSLEWRRVDKYTENIRQICLIHLAYKMVLKLTYTSRTHSSNFKTTLRLVQTERILFHFAVPKTTILRLTQMCTKMNVKRDPFRVNLDTMMLFA